MILDTLLAKAAYRLFAVIFSIYCSISGAAVMPSTETPIRPSGDANLVFAAIADPQVGNYQLSRYKYFQAASADLRAAEGLDAMLVAGDIAENGLTMEYQLFYDNLGGMDLRYVVCVGNHDIRLRDYNTTAKKFNNFVNVLNGDDSADCLHHSEMINGYKFIVLGSDKTMFEESYLSNEQLSWLDSELASQNGRFTFVMIHQPLKFTHGLPDVWGSPFNNAGSIGDQSDKVREILNKYNNVIFITGHEHTGFGQYTYEKVDNFHSVNLPGFAPNNANAENTDHGLGCIVEVYDNSIIFRARDMCQGKWLPEYDITIPCAE